MVLLCPYTKVEESFSMQAVHDILYHRTELSSYDHHEFPGVVARTFLGPLTLAGISTPGVLLLHGFFGASTVRVWVQLWVRLVLGACVLLALQRFQVAIERRHGGNVAIAFGLLMCTQFHFMFYISRTLPNVFALALVLLALAYWLDEQLTASFSLFTLVVVVFRSEVVLLLGGVALDCLVRRRISLWGLFRVGIVAAVLCLIVSVPIDSWMWRRFIWPEGSVLRFNVLENKSHIYGTQPWHWYFSSALPRALLGCLPLALIGLGWIPRSRRICFPAFVFVALYSLLPHKELRFIFYAIPCFTVAAAEAAVGAWEFRRKSRIPVLLVVGIAVCSLGFSGLFLHVSSKNYPGGDALQLLHRLKATDSDLEGASVWLDNLACQTGITRFLQLRSDWLYDKTETGINVSDYSFIITEKDRLDGFKEIGSVEQFSHFAKWPPRLITKVALRIFQNQDLLN